MVQPVRVLHEISGDKVHTVAAGQTVRIHDPAVGVVTKTLQSGQKLRVWDTWIGDRTIVVP